MATVSITYQCGHRTQITYYPNTAPHVGDVLICYECGRQVPVKTVQVHTDQRATTGKRHAARAFKHRRF